MSFEFQCPQCQATLRLADEHAGMQARCPSCNATFVATPPNRPASAPASFPAPMAASSNPYASPSYTAADPTQPVGEGEWSPRQIDSGEVLSRAWEIFKQQWAMASVAVLIVGLINFGIQQGSNIIVQVLAIGVKDVAVVILANLIFAIGGWLIQIWLGIGQTMVFLDVARGKDVQIGKLFGGLPYLLNTIGAVLLLMLFVFGIVLVCVGVPALVGALAQIPELAAIGTIAGMLVALFPIVYVCLMYSQIQVLVIDRGLNPLEALSVSKEITDGNKMTLFLIGLMLFLIGIGVAIVGLLAACVGIIPAMIGFGAYSALALVIAYLQMTGQFVIGDAQQPSAVP